MQAAHAQGKKEIAVTNFTSGEVIRYSTPLIMGSLADDKAEKVTLVNESSKRKTATMTGLAHKGRFKVLADLVPGDNKLVIKSAKGSSTLNITFKPQTNPHMIRAVYYTDKTGNTKYPSPVPNDKCDVKAKLSTAMLMMQSFTAECMNQNGYGRKTFNVELQADGTVQTYVAKGNQEPNSGLNGGAMDEAINNLPKYNGPLYHLILLGDGMGYTAIGGIQMPLGAVPTDLVALGIALGSAITGRGDFCAKGCWRWRAMGDSLAGGRSASFRGGHASSREPVFLRHSPRPQALRQVSRAAPDARVLRWPCRRG